MLEQAQENIKIPLYISVYEQIYNKIKSEIFKPGEKLPGEYELSESMNISRGTLRQALLLLQEDGIIYNRQGIGNFVSVNNNGLETGLEKSSMIPIKFSKKPCVTQLSEVIYQPSTKTIQENLNLEKTKLVAIFELVFIVNKEIIGNSAIIIPYDILEEYDVDIENNDEMKRFIINYIDSNTINSRTSFRVIEARESVAKRLEVDEGTSILCFYEVMFSQSGIPITYSKSYCIPIFFDFYINRKK